MRPHPTLLWGVSFGRCPEAAGSHVVSLPWGWQRLTRHARCAVRLLALLPFVVLVGVAWLAATLLAGAWTVLALPLRRRGPTTLD